MATTVEQDACNHGNFESAVCLGLWHMSPLQSGRPFSQWLVMICRCLECLPLPMKSEHRHCRLLSDWPLIAMVVDAGHGLSQNASEEDNVFIACRIKLYSLQRHSFVHSIGVPGKLWWHQPPGLATNVSTLTWHFPSACYRTECAACCIYLI